jgi:hypothetical protein
MASEIRGFVLLQALSHRRARPMFWVLHWAVATGVLVLGAFSPAPALAQEPNPPPPNVRGLWQEYPLQPPSQPARPQRDRAVPEQEQASPPGSPVTSADPPAGRPSDPAGSGGWSVPWWVIVAGALGLVAASGLALAVRAAPDGTRAQARHGLRSASRGAMSVGFGARRGVHSASRGTMAVGAAARSGLHGAGSAARSAARGAFRGAESVGSVARGGLRALLRAAIAVGSGARYGLHRASRGVTAVGSSASQGLHGASRGATAVGSGARQGLHGASRGAASAGSAAGAVVRQPFRLGRMLLGALTQAVRRSGRAVRAQSRRVGTYALIGLVGLAFGAGVGLLLIYYLG